jgi:hypothetical protein
MDREKWESETGEPYSNDSSEGDKDDDKRARRAIQKIQYHHQLQVNIVVSTQ